MMTDDRYVEIAQELISHILVCRINPEFYEFITKSMKTA